MKRVTAAALTGAFLAAVALAALLATVVLPYRHGAPTAVADRLLGASDFGAFYCAALVARDGADPYALEPLRSCEIRNVYTPGGLAYANVGIDPAPLPAYDFALTVPLTYLPYRAAGLVWTALLVLATLAGAAALARLARLPFAATLAVTAFANGTVCFAFGQEQPVVTLALAVAALLVARDRPRAAAAVASLALIEPHVGLPVMLSLGLWTRGRSVALGACAAFGLLGLAFGPQTYAEYFARVLPAHAFAEVPVPFQYSLTSVLYLLRVPDGAALAAGSLQYAAMLVAGVALARPLARRIGAPALVLFPPAAAVVGGTFMHITEIASALPLGLYVAGTVPEIAPLAWAATLAIGLPWPAYGASREALALDALALGYAVWFALRTSPAGLRLGLAAVALALYAGSGRATERLPAIQLRPPEAPSAVTARFDPRLASTRYARETRETPALHDASPRALAGRVPTWLGLLALVALAPALLRRRAPVAAGGAQTPAARLQS